MRQADLARSTNIASRTWDGYRPVPVKLAVCGLPVALSITVRVPVRVPLAVGLNRTLIVQLCPAVREVPQVLVCEKSPLVAMLVMVNVPVPVFFRVTVLAELVVPTVREGYERLVGVKVTAGAPAVAPVPERVIECGLPEALSPIEIDPV